MTRQGSVDRRFLARGSFSALAINAGGRLLALAVTFVIARLLGAAEFGVYAVAMSWVTLMAVFSSLGFPTLLLREVSVGLAERSWARLHGVLAFSGRAVLAVSVSLALAGSALASLAFDGEHQRTLQLAVCLSMLLVPLRAFSKIRNGALRGARAIVRAQLPELIIRPGLVLCFAVVAMVALPERLGPIEAVGLQIAAGIVALLIGTWWLWKTLPEEIWQPRPEYHARSWFVSATHLLLFAGMTVLLAQSGVIVMGFLSSEAETGTYALSIRISEALLIFMAAVNMPLMPIIARLHGEGRRDAIQGYLVRGALYSCGAVLPFAVLLFLFGGPVLEQFGPGFSSGQHTLQLLVIAQVLSTVFGPVGLLLNVSGLERSASHGMAVAAVVNVGLCVLLVPGFAAEGAAWAMIISTLTWNIWLSVVAWKRLGLIPGLLGSVRGR